MPYKDFDTLNVEYRFQGVLETVTPLSVGAGKVPTGGVDNPIIRNPLGRPFIPGSSLKGIIRAEVERYVRSVYGSDAVCDILNPTGDRGELKLKEEQGDSYEPCLVCKVFGGPTIASHITFFDATPIEYRTETVTRVSISRITGGQFPGRLFDLEFISPGSKFRWEFIVTNIDVLDRNSDEAKIVHYFINLLRRGYLQIGGKKSVGYGRVRLVELKVLKFDPIQCDDVDVTSVFMKILESE